MSLVALFSCSQKGKLILRKYQTADFYVVVVVLLLNIEKGCCHLDLIKKPFIDAICKCANWETLASGQHENSSVLQTRPYQKLPNNLWTQKIKAKTKKLYSVHIFCNRTLRSSQESQPAYQTPSFLDSQTSFLFCIFFFFFLWDGFPCLGISFYVPLIFKWQIAFFIKTVAWR